MYTLGQGAQFKVTTDGDRVFKTLNTLEESIAIYKSWGYGFIVRDLEGLASATLDHARTSLQGIRKAVETYPELAPSLANPVIDQNSNYTQDKVTVFGEALRASSRTKAKHLIDQYIDLQLFHAGYGIADPKLQVGINYGVDKNSSVVLLDLGELTLEKDAAVAATAAKKWRRAVTYWVPPPYPMKHTIPLSLKPYYRKQMLTRLTPEIIAANWLKETKIG
jgi:hypothetical protein